VFSKSFCCQRITSKHNKKRVHFSLRFLRIVNSLTLIYVRFLPSSSAPSLPEKLSFKGKISNHQKATTNCLLNTWFEEYLGPFGVPEYEVSSFWQICYWFRCAIIISSVSFQEFCVEVYRTVFFKVTQLAVKRELIVVFVISSMYCGIVAMFSPKRLS